MGLLTDLIGGAAMSANTVLQRQNKAEEEEALIRARSAEAEQRAVRMEELRSKMQLERDRTLQALKDEREQTQQKRLIDDTMKARSRSEEIGADRRFAQFKKDGLSAGYFEGMSDDEIKGIFKEQYDDRRVTAEAGGDRYQDKTQSVKAGDRLVAAQETGNTGLITTALKGVDDARQSDKLVADELHKERKLKQDADIADRKDALGWARIEALVNGKGGGKSNEIRDTLSLIDSKRKTIASEEDNIIKLIKDSVDPAEKTALKKKLDGFAAEREELKSMQKALTARLSGEQPATEKREEPKGKAYDGVNPDGSVRYKPASNAVPDITPADVGRARGSMKLLPGETDAKQILLDEYKRAVASGNQSDIAAIASELKRIGVNVSNEPSQSNPSGGQSNRIVSIKRVG